MASQSKVIVGEWVTIGNYRVNTHIDEFRIFPKGKDGRAIPITKIDMFLRLKCETTGVTTNFKRFLYRGGWLWRDSREAKPVHESDITSEVARMLFKGDREQARGLLVKFVTREKLA